MVPDPQSCRNAPGRPLLLLDVDGVLQPTGSSVPPFYVRHETDDAVVVLNPMHGLWLRDVVPSFEVMWASTWGASANRLIGARLGLPPFPHVDLGTLGRDGTRKLQSVQDFVGSRPCAWVDDELYDDAYAWASERAAPTLLLRTRASVGFTLEQVVALQAFAKTASAPPR